MGRDVLLIVGVWDLASGGQHTWVQIQIWGSETQIQSAFPKPPIPDSVPDPPKSPDLAVLSDSVPDMYPYFKFIVLLAGRV